MPGTHRAGVLQGSRDDEPGQALALHTGCDGHAADAHHLCLGLPDRDRQAQQAVVRRQPVFVPDTEVFFLRQPDQTGRGDTEGIIAVAEDLSRILFKIME